MAPEPGQKIPGGSIADQATSALRQPSQPPSIQEETDDEANTPTTVRQGAAADQPRQYGKMWCFNAGRRDR